jgi:hypothetical protein
LIALGPDQKRELTGVFGEYSPLQNPRRPPFRSFSAFIDAPIFPAWVGAWTRKKGGERDALLFQLYIAT